MIEQTLAAFLTALAATSPNAAAGNGPGACSIGFPAYVKLPPPVISNELVIAVAGTWHWNGSVVTEADVGRFLKFIGGMNPRPQMVLSSQTGADCETVKRAQTLLENSSLCSDGNCFSAGAVEKLPQPPSAPPAPPVSSAPPNPFLSPVTGRIADKIRDESIPASGQSLTVEGELIRAVDKLRYEARGNGNINRDRGHQMLIDYLETTLNNKTVFSDEERQRIRIVISRVRPDNKVELNEAVYDYLIGRIVQYYQALGTQPHTINPKLHR